MNLNEICKNFESVEEVLNYISDNNLSKEYTILHLETDNINASNKKLAQILSNSNNNIDIFLRIILEEEGKYSKYIKRRRIQNEMQPKILKDVGYMIDSSEVNINSQIFIQREKINKKIDVILNKKLKNNILIVGKPGTGKTSAIEQYVKLRKLKNVLVIQSAKLIGGCETRGSFEQKVVDILDFAINKKLIIFFDELHALIDLGRAIGGMSITDIMKPYLSNGKIQFIGATTEAELNILLADEAFKRRFNIIRLPEFTDEELLKLKLRVEASIGLNGIKINDYNTTNAIDKLRNELPNLYFPDKFLDFLDYYYSYIETYEIECFNTFMEEYIIDNK